MLLEDEVVTVRVGSHEGLSTAGQETGVLSACRADDRGNEFMLFRFVVTRIIRNLHRQVLTMGGSVNPGGQAALSERLQSEVKASLGS